MDKVKPIIRSRNMSRIRSKNTNPEITLRKLLFLKGFRFRIHYNIPGRPDIVFPSKKLAIFVNGCFWHGHSCEDGHIPKTNVIFWKEKIKNNKSRDDSNVRDLKQNGWNVLTFWECEIENDLGGVINTIKNIIHIAKDIRKNIIGE